MIDSRKISTGCGFDWRLKSINKSTAPLILPNISKEVTKDPDTCIKKKATITIWNITNVIVSKAKFQNFRISITSINKSDIQRCCLPFLKLLNIYAYTRKHWNSRLSKKSDLSVYVLKMVMRSLFPLLIFEYCTVASVRNQIVCTKSYKGSAFFYNKSLGRGNYSLSGKNVSLFTCT